MSQSSIRVGTELNGTCLTIIGPDGNSWRMIRCRCDCGNEFTASYQTIFYNKYSCGCRRRLRGSMFREGVRVPDTMLTVLRPEDPGSWANIRCLCDCGTETTVRYQALRAGQFSCGCKRRLSFDAVDHSGWTSFTAYGNGGYGRKLTILYRDRTISAGATCATAARKYSTCRGSQARCAGDALRIGRRQLSQLSRCVCARLRGEPTASG